MKNNVFYGILILIIGLLLGGNSLGIWDVDVFFKGWWTFFIIIPSCISIYNKDYRTGLTALSIGIFFFLLSNDIISWSLFFPYILVLIGLSMILEKNKK